MGTEVGPAETDADERTGGLTAADGTASAGATVPGPAGARGAYALNVAGGPGFSPEHVFHASGWRSSSAKNIILIC